MAKKRLTFGGLKEIYEKVQKAVGIDYANYQNPVGFCKCCFTPADFPYIQKDWSIEEDAITDECSFLINNRDEMNCNLMLVTDEVSNEEFLSWYLGKDKQEDKELLTKLVTALKEELDPYGYDVIMPESSKETINLVYRFEDKPYQEGLAFCYNCDEVAKTNDLNDGLCEICSGEDEEY